MFHMGLNMAFWAILCYNNEKPFYVCITRIHTPAGRSALLHSWKADDAGIVADGVCHLTAHHALVSHYEIVDGTVSVVTIIFRRNGVGEYA